VKLFKRLFGFSFCGEKICKASFNDDHVGSGRYDWASVEADVSGEQVLRRQGSTAQVQHRKNHQGDLQSRPGTDVIKRFPSSSK